MDSFHSEITTLKTCHCSPGVVSLLNGRILHIREIKERLKLEEYR